MHSDADRAKPPRPADSQYRILAAERRRSQIACSTSSAVMHVNPLPRTLSLAITAA